MDELQYYLWLNLHLGAGSRAAVRLVRAAGGARAVWEELSEELFSRAKVKRSVLGKLLRARDLTEPLEILEKCKNENVTVLCPKMKEYPKSLLCTMDYPMVLFCKGVLPDFNTQFFCGVVGTRKMSDYGRRAAYEIGLGLGDGGAVLVSGIALGVDAMAMAGAISAGGVTVGVLGCGIDVVYPAEHKEFFATVAERGAIITEYLPGTPPKGHHFPMRNRIISGLCQAVAVIEGDLKSGALITARHAVFQGREVFALPGNIDEPGAEGPNRLISEGATVVLEANDIISRYEFLYPHSLKPARVITGGADTSGEVARLSHISSAGGEKGKSYGGGYLGGEDAKKKKKAPPSDSEAPPPRMTAEPPSDMDKEREVQKKLRRTVQSEEDLSSADVIACEKIDKLDFNHVDGMEPLDREIYNAMRPDTPTLPDELVTDEISIGQVLTVMTRLELVGAVEIGAGGYYIKCTSEEDYLFETEET